MLGHRESLLTVSWPEYSEKALEVDKRLVVLQVNGKVRDRIEVPASFGRDEIQAEALKSKRVQSFVAGAQIKKVIVVRDKLVNIVV